MSNQNPVKVFRKLAVKSGVYHQTYIDPVTEDVHRSTVYISPEYLRKSAWSTMQMKRRSLEVPICIDHKDDAYPRPVEQWLENEMRSSVGRLIDVTYNPKEQSHEYQFEINDPQIAQKIEQGIITKVSPNFHSSFSPGDGTVWKNVVGHLALTFRPKDYHQSSAPMATVSRAGQKRFSVLSVDRDTIVKIVPMYKMPFSVLAGMLKPSGKGFKFSSVDYDFDFKTKEEFTRWLSRRYRQTLRMSVSGKMGHVLYFAVIHAPAGGVVVNGKKYLGGQFIPNAHVEGLPTEERDKIRSASAEWSKKRTETARKYVSDNESDKDAVARHAGEHAKAEMTPEDKKAAMRRWASLRGYHGDTALRQVAVLAGKESAQLATLDPNSAKALHIKRRLRAYHEMAQAAKMPEAVPMKAAASEAKETKYPIAPKGEWHGEGTYEADGGKMVEMSPDDYISQVRPLTMDDESRENIDILKKHIQDGKTLDPLLIRANGKEDGRHRAHAARELGIKSIPVIDYRNTKSSVELSDKGHSNALAELSDAQSDVSDAQKAAHEKSMEHKAKSIKEFQHLPPHIQERITDIARKFDSDKSASDIDHDLALSEIAEEVYDAYDYSGLEEQEKPTDWVDALRNKSRKQIRDEHYAKTKNLAPKPAAPKLRVKPIKEKEISEAKPTGDKLPEYGQEEYAIKHNENLKRREEMADKIHAHYGQYAKDGIWRGRPAGAAAAIGDLEDGERAHLAKMLVKKGILPEHYSRKKKVIASEMLDDIDVVARQAWKGTQADNTNPFKEKTARQFGDNDRASPDANTPIVSPVDKRTSDILNAPKSKKTSYLDSIMQENQKHAKIDATEQAKPADTPTTEFGKHNPWHAKREEVFKEMRRLDDEIEQHNRAAMSMQPKHGQIGWGGADFDHTLKRTVTEAYYFALNKGKSPDEAHKEAIEAGRDAVNNWNNKTSKGRASANGHYELKRWDKSGDDHADMIHRRFSGIGNPGQAKPADVKPEKQNPESNYTTEEDDEGNIRGVIKVPKEKAQGIFGYTPPTETIKGRWREKNWANQDGDDKMHEKLRRDILTAHAQNLERSHSQPGSSSEFDERQQKINAGKNGLAKHMHQHPEGRPETLAEYVEASGLTRKYRVEPEHSAGHDSGIGYGLWYDQVDDSGKVVKSNRYNSVSHPTYDDAAIEMAQHADLLNRNGHGDPVKIHDPKSKEHHEKIVSERKVQEKQQADKEESERSGAAAKYRANSEAITQLRSEIKSTKRKQHSMKIGEGTAKGVRHDNFLVHKPVHGGTGYRVTHIPSGMAAFTDATSQGQAIEIAHLLAKAGDWSNPKPDNNLLSKGAGALRHYRQGNYADALEHVKKKVESFGVVHAPQGGTDVDGHHYLGGQFTPGQGGAKTEQKASAPSADQKRSFYRKADGHAKKLGLKPMVAVAPGIGKVNGYKHGNMLIHKNGDRWQITHAPTGKRIGASTYKDDAIRKAYLLHHGLDWNFAGEADPVHSARFKDVAKGHIPRDMDEGSLHPTGGIPDSHKDQRGYMESWMKYKPNYESAKQRYIATHGTFDDQGNLKSVVANIDHWRDYIPGYNGLNAPDTHPAAKYANERFLDEIMDEMKGRGNGKIAVLGGGGGSGKGTAVGNHFDEREYPIRLDQTSSDYDSLITRIKDMQAKGYEPDIVFVDRRPREAWHGVVGRTASLIEKGHPPRVVPKRIAIEANISAREAALKLAKENPDITLRVIDNHGGHETSRLLKNRDEVISHLANQKYNIDEELQEADNHVEKLEKQGKIPAHVAQALRA